MWDLIFSCQCIFIVILSDTIQGHNYSIFICTTIGNIIQTWAEEPLEIFFVGVLHLYGNLDSL